MRESGREPRRPAQDYFVFTALRPRPSAFRDIDMWTQWGAKARAAEYDAAKEAQGLHEAKIAQMQETVANARLLDESKLDTSKVLALSIVKIKNVRNGATMSYQLVSESEADLKSGKISVASPIAKGLLGKKVGDKTEIQVPAGKMEFEILEISR